jgi:nitroimidazol reductase NimA-like FMN-containing flavoprotein (pyridoxamine 5'-phosphate oxidase superfamily)
MPHRSRSSDYERSYDHDMRPRIARLDAAEIASLLALDIPAHLGTTDPDGYPRITPIWFMWEGGAFRMTSVEGQPHLRNLARDPRAAICVDTEAREPVDGIRAHRRFRAQGLVEAAPDHGGYWTRLITLKYISGPDGEEAAERRAAMPRVVITLQPERFLAQR